MEGWREGEREDERERGGEGKEEREGGGGREQGREVEGQAVHAPLYPALVIANSDCYHLLSDSRYWDMCFKYIFSNLHHLFW